MKLVFTLIFILSSAAFAALLDMPLGGKLPVDTKTWDVQSLKKVPGSHSMIFIHKKYKDLKGLVFDGNIKGEGLCDPKNTSKSWKTCVRKVPMGKDLSFQLLTQRMIGPQTFQTYVLSFNYPSTQDSTYDPELQKLRKTIEANHE